MQLKNELLRKNKTRVRYSNQDEEKAFRQRIFRRSNETAVRLAPILSDDVCLRTEAIPQGRLHTNAQKIQFRPLHSVELKN